jgi:hypothetical protein
MSSWRINRCGLTLITVDSPTLDRAIEISDSEITVDLFRQFRPNHPYVAEVRSREKIN